MNKLIAWILFSPLVWWASGFFMARLITKDKEINNEEFNLIVFYSTLILLAFWGVWFLV